MLELKLENGKYYYYENGQKVTGWFQDKDNRWYHLKDTDGSLDTNWFHASGYGDKWFYAYTENIEEGEKKHYLGEMATGWIQLDNKWYFLLTERLEYNSNTHCKGEMVTAATLIINNKGYTFDEHGVMENGYSLVSDSLVSFIVDLEIFHDKTYEDPSHIGDQNYWTIGYGTRYSDNPSAFLNGLSSTCTKDQGLIYLKEKITKIANTIKVALGDTVLSQQTFDTLCDIAYTEGTDAVTYSKTWDAIVNGTSLISTYIMSWNKSNGKYSGSLNQRCKYRCNMCLNGMWYFKVGWKQVGDKWKYQCYDGTFQTGWKLIEDKWYYFNNNGEMQIGWIKETDGKYYYLYTEATEKDGHTEHKEGEMATGWIKVNGQDYYMFRESKIGDDKHKIGEMAIGDRLIDGNWYYFYSSGEMAANFWEKGKNDTYYYYNSSGKMVTGWETIEGKHYHFDSSSGVMKRGWFDYNNNTYYFYYDGSMALGFMEKAVGSDTWYYFNIDTGINETGWAKDFNGKWYYLDINGIIQTGWLKDKENKWYYLYTEKTYDHSKGQMAIGWIQLDGNWYYLHTEKTDSYSKGEMATGWVKDNAKYYYCDPSGVMQTGWIKLEGKYYYLCFDGVMAINWTQVDNDWYYFNSDGVMQTGWIYDNDKGGWYYLDGNGIMAHDTTIDGYYVDSNGKRQTEEMDTNLYMNGKYDRDVAVTYAINSDYSSPDKNGESVLDWEKHTRNYNHDYERYDSYDYYLKGHLSGSDCANFISQALYAGGVKQTDDFYFKWEVHNPETQAKIPVASGSWIRPEAQLQYLKDTGYVNGNILEVNSPEQANADIEEYNIQEGDLIYLKNNSEGLHHSMMITKVENRKIYISAHSNDHINSEYDSNYFQDGNIGVIVRIK